MLSCADFFRCLTKEGLRFYSGVPDSLLKHIGAYISDHSDDRHHVIAPNEGSAVALAAGYHLGTGEIPVVYLQNSGLGNAVNPITSLADPAVYGIPMLLLVGWRGQPGVQDEPQHAKMGSVTPQIAAALGLPCEVLPATIAEAERVLSSFVQLARSESTPVVLLVEGGTFDRYRARQSGANDGLELSREHAIQVIADTIPADAVIVSTTGKISRELAEYNDERGFGTERTFLMVGSMGHCCQLALGIALSNPTKKVYCLDGDGAALMHMGSLATVGSLAPPNLFHIVLNNGAHESVGGQPTVARDIDLSAVALACGYISAVKISVQVDLQRCLVEQRTGPTFIDVHISLGSRPDLGRPRLSPRENKARFMASL